MRLSLIPAIFCVGSLAIMTSCSPSQEPIVLKYDFGNGFERKSKFNYDMVMEVPDPTTGGQNQVDMNMQYDMNIKGASAGEGNNSLEIVYERIAMTSEVDTMRMAYDSETGENTMEEAGLTFGALVNTPLVMDFSPQGEVSNVQGFEEMIDKMINSMYGGDTIASQTIAMMKAQMIQQFSIDQLQSQMGLYNLEYSDKAVAVDSSWEFSFSQSMSVPLLIEGTYTVTDISDATVTLHMDADVNMDPAAGPMAMMFEMTGSQTGDIVVDRSTGWIESYTGVLDASASFDPSTMGGGDAQPMEMKIAGKFSLQAE